ncbi:hypothetical protein GPECTOR_1g433 [Gonium pectorale]|uniref:Protein kinase domain-containing protein n=1 Tax=Gonium pectorale TaxID=33097 RepID=A0A150H378_GONPE|nr:hypothetical protein GPECTOR_1g433 [Gonium pectorale]|eukprot:KXZ56484.1 hypothetical protein GPECTOR_1g433 [Gonium pectorale]
MNSLEDIARWQGASLHLRDLTLLLPAPPPEALAVAPASVLAHLITASGSAAAADGGEDASPTAVSVLLSDVTLMLPGDAELRAFMSRLCESTSWQHRGAAQLRVLGGVAMYGNDTMQLAPPAPPAVLLRTNVTSRSASAAPWACSATAVSGAGELRATAAELLAVTSGTVLLSLTGNVTIDPETGGWGPSGLVVPEGSQLGLYGDPTPGRATQLDFGGLESALSVRPGGVVVLADLVLLGLPYPRDVQRPTTLLAAWVHSLDFGGLESALSVRPGGVVVLADLVLLGLPYPRDVQRPTTLLAAWVHSVAGFASRLPDWFGMVTSPLYLHALRCTVVVPELELAWWRAAVDAWEGEAQRQEPRTQWHIPFDWSLTLEDGGSCGVPTAGAAVGSPASAAPLCISMRDSGAARVMLSSCTLTSLGASGAVASPQAAAVAASWPLGAQYGEGEALQLRLGGFMRLLMQTAELFSCNSLFGSTLLVPSSWVSNAFPWELRSGSEANGSFVFLYEEVVRGLGPRGPEYGVPCTLKAPPVSQTRRRTFWDMRRSEANGSFVFLYEEVVRGLGPRGPEYGVPCTLKAPPVSQTRRRTFWDMRGLRQGLRDAVSLPPTSPWALTLDGLVLYNLPPTGIEPPAPPPGPQGLAQPPELPAYDPPAPPLPAPPSPAPPLDLALSGMALPLWAFTFDRSPSRSLLLRLRNVTLVVPPAELALLRGLLESVGALTPAEKVTEGTAGGYSSNAGAGSNGDGSSGGGRRLHAGLVSAVRALAADSSGGPTAAAGPCPRDALLSYASSADVSGHSATAISFRRLSFHGWEGRDVTVTSDFPPDAPTFQLPFDTAGLGPELEAACPQPPPPPPSPPMLAASLSPPALPTSGPGCRWRTPSQRAAGPHTQLVRAVERSQAALQADTAGEGAVRLLRIIGRGSYGVVHLGVWRGLAVAAKVLVVHDTLLGAEGRARQRAVLEAAVGASLDHPNVVATYAYGVRPLGEQPGDKHGGDESGSDPRVGGSSSTPDVYQLHILQEFCSGGSLKEALGSRGALGGGVLAGGVSAAIALRLAFDVAAGLRHVHAAGIVHGDVSAGNVLLARRSAPEDSSDAERGGVDTAEAGWRSRLTAAGPPPLPVVAKVADFGLSVRLAGSATHASGCYQGTPTYIAPEVHGRGRVSRTSDVYSFGVLLLELVHGMPVAALWEATVPTTSLASASTAGNAAGASPLLALLSESLRGSSGPVRCPAGLRALLEACLASDPAGRPTMEQVGAAEA